MTDREELRSNNETLLAIGVNEGEPPIDVLLASATAAIPLDVLLRRCSTIGASLANAEDQRRDDATFWLDVATSLTEQPLPQELIDGIRSGWRLTNIGQLANLALYAVANQDYHGIAQPKSFLRLLGLFNYAVLKHPDSGRFFIEPDSVAGGFAVTTSHRVRFMNVADRYLTFVEWSDGQPNADVRALVQETVGMSFEDYLRCIAALQAFFDPSDAGINGIPSLNRHAIRPDVPLLKWLDDRSHVPEQLDMLLGKNRLRTLRDRGYYLIQERPFVRLGDLYYLLNHRALENALGLGVFFAAMDAKTARVGVNRDARRNAAKEFGGVAGRFYEQYAGERVRRIAERSASYFHGEVLVDGFRSTDFFVLEGDRLVLFEMHHGRVARDVVEGLEDERINKSFEQVVYAKVEQLDCTIRAFAEGRLVVPGIDPICVARLYPVVCLPSAFPRSPSIQAKMDSDIAARGWLSPRVGRYEVAPFEIIDAESLEGLDGTQRPALFSELIDEKTADAHTRFLFFKNFLINIKRLSLQMDSYDQQRRAERLNRLQQEAADWILQH